MKTPKPFPSFNSDEEAEDFVSNAELTENDLSNYPPMTFQINKKHTPLNIRLPRALHEAAKKKAQQEEMSLSQYVRSLLEADIYKAA